METVIIRIILSIAAVYFSFGLAFALLFVYKGAARIDPCAAAGSWGFKILIIPGSALFWPLLLLRWMKGANTPPEERSPHRKAAKFCEKRAA